MACQVAVVCQVTHLLTAFLLWTWQVILFRFTLLVAFVSIFVPFLQSAILDLA